MKVHLFTGLPWAAFATAISAEIFNAGDDLCDITIDSKDAMATRVDDRQFKVEYYPWTADRGLEALTTKTDHDHLPTYLSCVQGHVPEKVGDPEILSWICTTDTSIPWPKCITTYTIWTMLYGTYQYTTGVPVPPKGTTYDAFDVYGRSFIVPDPSTFDNNSARMSLTYHVLDKPNSEDKIVTVTTKDPPSVYTSLACLFSGPVAKDFLYCINQASLDPIIKSYCSLKNITVTDALDESSTPEPQILLGCGDKHEVSNKPLLPDNPVNQYHLPDNPGDPMPIQYLNFYHLTDVFPMPANADKKNFIGIHHVLNAKHDNLPSTLYCLMGPDPSQDDTKVQTHICVYDPRDWPAEITDHCVFTKAMDSSTFLRTCGAVVRDRNDKCQYRAPSAGDIDLQFRHEVEYYLFDPKWRQYSQIGVKSDSPNITSLHCVLGADPWPHVKNVDKGPRRTWMCKGADFNAGQFDACLRNACRFQQVDKPGHGMVYQAICDV